MKQIRGYIFSRPFLDERVPQNVQNLVIREFCKKENLFYNLSASEYAMMNCYKILNQLIHELKNLDGIVAYSVFQLPENNEKRNKIFMQMLKRKKIFYLNCSKPFQISHRMLAETYLEKSMNTFLASLH